eukprot:Gb_01745 [translate_table: standard]
MNGSNLAFFFYFRMEFEKGCHANHQFSTNLQRRIYGHATNVAIRPLDEEKAVQAATDLLGELFIFSVSCHIMEAMLVLIFLTTTVGGAAVIFEVQRSSRSEARKEEARKQELENASWRQSSRSSSPLQDPQELLCMVVPMVATILQYRSAHVAFLMQSNLPNEDKVPHQPAVLSRLYTRASVE